MVPWKEAPKLYGLVDAKWVHAAYFKRIITFFAIKGNPLNKLMPWPSQNCGPPYQTYFHALLRLAVVLVLKGKARDLITWLGIKCSSFIGLNVGTSGRSPSNPYGNWHFPSVRQSNMLLERSHAMFSGIWHLVFFPGSPMLPF